MRRVTFALVCLACSASGRRLPRSSRSAGSKKSQKLSEADFMLEGTATEMLHASSAFVELLLASDPGAAFELPLQGKPSLANAHKVTRQRLGLPVMDPASVSAPAAVDIASVDSVEEDPFEALVKICEERMKPPYIAPANFEEVPRLLHKVLEDDYQQLLSREKIVQNVTCLCPRDEGTGFDLYGKDAITLPLVPGRLCDGGHCSDACSRVTLPSFFTPSEVVSLRQLLDKGPLPENSWFEQIIFRGDARMTLTHLRILERMRRFISHEYGVALSSLRPLTFLCPIVYHRANYFSPGKPNTAHSDESVVDGIHYSGIFYMTTENEDFEGGTFHWTDAEQLTEDGVPDGERMMTPISPKAGLAFILSSGWENIHYFDPITKGCRISMPAFFTTRPYPEEEEMFYRKPVSTAEVLWRSLLRPTTLDDFEEFKENWHDLLTEP